MTLNDLERAVYENVPSCIPKGATVAGAVALAVAETLLNHLSELADDEPLDGHELRAVLAELKGEMK